MSVSDFRQKQQHCCCGVVCPQFSLVVMSSDGYPNGPEREQNVTSWRTSFQASANKAMTGVAYSAIAGAASVGLCVIRDKLDFARFCGDVKTFHVVGTGACLGVCACVALGAVLQAFKAIV